VPSFLKSLKLLADPTRIRILRVLREQELSVAELQEILGMGQSRISTQLAQLKKEGMVEDRRSGKNILYGLMPVSVLEKKAHAQLLDIVDTAAREIPEAERDAEALALALKKRSDTARAYFDQLAGKFGRNYVAGRSWKGLAEMLLRLMEPKVIADLGAGEGTLAQLLAQRAEQVIAVDNSEKMVEFGSNLAREHGFGNLEYRLGDIERIPIEDGSVDLAIFSQALHHANKPRQAVEESFRILRPGGRIVVLDLLTHNFEDARSLYADVWLGFSEVEILEFLRAAGFEDPETAIVDRETENPHFQTLLAIAAKPTS
jgi:ubiquinone/menaquinone biosynthesis C-methylase UbiE/DNA-binding HxlR family transcriptional regulator